MGLQRVGTHTSQRLPDKPATPGGFLNWRNMRGFPVEISDQQPPHHECQEKPIVQPEHDDKLMGRQTRRGRFARTLVGAEASVAKIGCRRSTASVGPPNFKLYSSVYRQLPSDVPTSRQRMPGLPAGAARRMESLELEMPPSRMVSSGK